MKRRLGRQRAEQLKVIFNHLNINPFSSDYFYYDVFKDVVICPNGHTLKKFGFNTVKLSSISGFHKHSFK